LRRIRAGLDAREATHEAAGKLELRIFSSWRDSLAKNPGRAARALAHNRGCRNIGAAYFFEIEGLSCEESGQGGLHARWTTHGAAGKLELRIFSRWRDSLAKNPGRAECALGHARGNRKVGAWYFLSWRDSLAKNPGRAGRARGHAQGCRKVGLFFF
jgi:hypothetical protein